MRNFILGALSALCISGFAVTIHQDGSETYTHEELVNIKANFEDMEAEISRLNAELNKANQFFLKVRPIVKKCLGGTDI